MDAALWAKRCPKKKKDPGRCPDDMIKAAYLFSQYWACGFAGLGCQSVLRPVAREDLWLRFCVQCFAFPTDGFFFGGGFFTPPERILIGRCNTETKSGRPGKKKNITDLRGGKAIFLFPFPRCGPLVCSPPSSTGIRHRRANSLPLPSAGCLPESPFQLLLSVGGAFCSVVVIVLCCRAFAHRRQFRQ